MRAITAQEEATLAAPDGHSVAVRVWVWDGAAFQDVAALEGRNWLVSVEWDTSVDEPCAQATVALRRRLEDYSLNPLVSNKLTGVLALGRPFYIEAATLPLGDPPEESDYREVFRGKVETLTMDKDPLVFTGRDAAGDLSRAYIETDPETIYGSDAGVAVETIIQSILTDAGTGVTLYVRNASGGSTTGAVFGEFPQKKMAVLAAVRNLALKIGWDLRYVWDDGSSTWRFTLIEPDRSAVTSLWTFQPSKVKAVTKLSQTLFDVRNVIRLYYYDRSALSAGGKVTLEYVTAEDATSISTYGRQYMQLAESEDSPIDSASEAQTMANAARDDLKNPLLEFGVEVGFFYPVELGDLVTFAADDLNFSSNQTLAVVSLAHRIDARGHRTSLQLRGTAVAANEAWLARDGRVQLLRQPPVSAPAAVGSLTAESTASGAVFKFSAPTNPPYPVEYELHISTTSGFTPSSSTLAARSATTSFTRNDLTPGTTYYAQVVGLDKVGNRSAASEVSVTPRYVEPRTLQERISYGALPLNGDFEANNTTGAPPDAWILADGAWGTDVTLSTDAATGSYAVSIPAGKNPTFLSQLMVVRPNTDYTVQIMAKRTGVAAPLILSLIFYSDTSGTIVGSSSDTSTSPSSTYATVTHVATSPSTARYARVRLGSATTGGALFVDSVEVFRSSIPQRTWQLVGSGSDPSYDVTFSNGWTNYDLASWEQVGFRINSIGNVELKGLAKAPATAPAAGASMFTLPAGYRPATGRLFRINASSGATGVSANADGTIIVDNVSGGAYLSLEGIVFQPA